MCQAPHGQHLLLRLANAPLPSAPTPGAQGNGKPHVLAGYQVGGERRFIVVQRIRGAIRVGDLPADGKGKRYLVADDLKTCGELNDLLLDYNGQVAKLGAVPAGSAAIDHILELAA